MNDVDVSYINVTSSMDGSQQPCQLDIPEIISPKAPLLVFLHQWSTDYQKNNQTWRHEANKHNWIYLQPNFRGPNINPDACASKLAQQDIMDAIGWAKKNFSIDTKRIYLAGVSGGGHMTMMMAALQPHIFAAANEWVGISDLFRWYYETLNSERHQKYAKNIIQCVGGSPGHSETVNLELQQRSPINFIRAAKNVPIDFNAGVWDGHTGSVPFHHTIDAFNEIAIANETSVVTQQEISELWEKQCLTNPKSTDDTDDLYYQGKKILLRRHAGKSRLTIFEGGHEGIPESACQFLSKHKLN